MRKHSRKPLDPQVATFVNALRAAGLRITPQRLALCRALAGNTTHPTAAQLFAQVRVDFPTLSLATVYSTLNTLSNLGLVYELGTAGDGQKHYDPDPTPHPNLVCLHCHQIRDLRNRTLEGMEQRVANRSGYQILGARIVYYGLCPTCSKTRRQPIKIQSQRRI